MNSDKVNMSFGRHFCHKSHCCTRFSDVLTKSLCILLLLPTETVQYLAVCLFKHVFALSFFFLASLGRIGGGVKDDELIKD